jgi:hypothetical protein
MRTFVGATVERAAGFMALAAARSWALKSNPQKIIARGTDRRFLNEAKKELKA